MKALSIRQLWAWLIIHGGKDIENRDWATHFRGRILIHASKGASRKEYEDALTIYTGIAVPPFEALERGGIVGAVTITDCVKHSDSQWFFGTYGFVLKDPKPYSFVPWMGRLGFFEVPAWAYADVCDHSEMQIIQSLIDPNITRVRCIYCGSQLQRNDNDRQH